MSDGHSSKYMSTEVGDTIKKFLDIAPTGSVVTADIKKGSKSVDMTMGIKTVFSLQQKDEKTKPKKKNSFKREDQRFMKRAMSSCSEESSSTSFKGKKVEGPLPVRVHNLPTFRTKDEQYYEVGPLTAKDNSLNERRKIWDSITNGFHSKKVTKQVAKFKKTSIHAKVPEGVNNKK